MQERVSNHEQGLTPEDVECFREAPSLAGCIQGLSESEFAQLTRAWTKRTLQKGQSLEELGPALRLVLSGHVELTRQGWQLPGGVQRLERGSIHGLRLLAQREDPEERFGPEAMRRWLGQKSVARLLGPARVSEWFSPKEVAKLFDRRTLVQRLGNQLAAILPGANSAPPRAAVAETTTVLELPPERFQHVPSAVLQWLFTVHQADLLVEPLVAALGREPRFGNVSERALFRLAESASVMAPPEQPPLAQGTTPRDLHVLLSGHLQVILSDGKDEASLDAPVCIGPKQFLLQEEFVGEGALSHELGPDAWVLVRIDGGFFRRLLRTDASFRRAIHRNNPELYQEQRRPPSHQVLVLDAKDEAELPLALLAECLAERLAVHLQEHVRLLRIIKEGKEEGPVLPSTRIAVNGWVIRQTKVLPAASGRSSGKNQPLIPRPGELTGLSQEDSSTPGEADLGHVNVTLVDVSELSREDRTVALGQMARQMKHYPNEPLKLVYLAREPRDFPAPDGLPAGVRLVPTAVLSGELPAGLGMELKRALDKRSGWDERGKAILQAASGVGDLLGSMRKHLEQVNRPSEPRHPWPMGTVRLRLPASDRLQEVDGRFVREPAHRATFDRWARAATGRRVGVALGGGGTFGYVHVALLQKLHCESVTDEAPGLGGEDSAERLPIDMVSGSSFGAVVGAFYCVAGSEGLELMTRHWRLVAGAVPFGVLTSVGLQWWIDAVLGPAELAQLEVPLFPVVADADVGVEWDMEQGTVGYGVRASGSLPPAIAPTPMGNRRLLDGGIVANVPVNVLRAEGANLLLASNPIPLVSPRERTYPRGTLGALWRQLNPVLRLEDAYRMITLLVRIAGETQDQTEDVTVYHPRLSPASFFTFEKAEEITKDAANSVELGLFLLEARARWRALLNNPISLLKIDRAARMVRLTEPVAFLDNDALAPVREHGALAEVVAFLREHPEISSFRIVVTTASKYRASRQAASIKKYLGERVRREPPLDISTDGQQEMNEAFSKVCLEQVEGLVFEKLEELEDVLRRKDQQELRQALEDAEARRLILAAQQKIRTGEPELARMLAVKAAQLDRTRSPELEQFLRKVLTLKGSLRCRFEAEVAATSLAWSPDGRFLAVGYRDGTLRLWDEERGEECWRAHAHPGGTDPSINALAWSPGGELLASCGNDFRLVLWKHSRGRLQRHGPGYHLGTWEHWGLAFSPGEEYLLGPQGSPRVQRSLALFHVGREDVALGQPVWTASGAVQAAAWAPGSQEPCFATVGDGTVMCWKVTKGQPRELQTHRFAEASTLAWRPDGKRLAVGGGSGACILDLEGREILLDTGGMKVQRVEWNQDGSCVLATLEEGSAVHVWDDTGRLLTVLRMEDEGGLQELRCHPTRPEVTLTWGHELACVWDVLRGRRLVVLGGHEAAIQQATWNPRGTLVATASVDGTVQVWDPFSGGLEQCPWSKLAREPGKPGKNLLTFQWPREGVLAPLNPSEERPSAWGVFGPDWTQAVIPARSTQSGGASPRVWKPEAPPPEQAELEQSPAQSVHWSPDGGRVALHEPNHITVWDAKSWKLLAALPPQDTKLTRVAWHPHRPWLAVARFTGSSQVLLWNLAPPTPPLALQGEELDGVWDIAWSPRGERLATASNDRRVRIYDMTRALEESRLLHEFETGSPVRRLAWSPNGARLALGQENGGVVIWEPDGEGALASHQPVLRQRIQQLVWSQDGATLFSADERGHAHLWRAHEECWEAVSALEPNPTPLYWAAFSQDGKWVAAMGQGGTVRLYPVGFRTLVECVRGGMGEARRVVARPLTKGRTEEPSPGGSRPS